MYKPLTKESEQNIQVSKSSSQIEQNCNKEKLKRSSGMNRCLSSNPEARIWNRISSKPDDDRAVNLHKCVEARVSTENHRYSQATLTK